MRKTIAFLICLLLLCGCEKTQELQTPVTFYYPSNEVSYDIGCSFIEQEIREGAQMGSAENIMHVYLAGPENDQLCSPFPAGLQLLGMRKDGQTVYLTFNQTLASLSNLDLTLACSCITLTCLDLTGAQQVCIDAENSLLAGQKSIKMDRSSLLLTDFSFQGE